MKVSLILAGFALWMFFGYRVFRFFYPKPRRHRNTWWLRLKDQRLVALNRWRFFIKPDLKRKIRKVKRDA